MEVTFLVSLFLQIIYFILQSIVDRCGKTVILAVRFLDVSIFATLTSSLISHKYSFKIVGMKVSSCQIWH
jgi:hypothetical protein